MNWLYKLFYKGFLRYHESNKSTKEKLVYAFTDMEGVRYFTWGDKNLPKCRYDKLLELTMWWEARITPETANMLADGIIESLEISLTGETTQDRSKAVSRAIVMANELKLRKENGIPAKVANDMAAVWAIREDEDPGIINEQVHAEKVDMFAREAAAGRDFFLHLPRLMNHLNLWRVRREELKRLFLQSEEKEKRIQTIVPHLLSGLRSETTTKAKER